MTRHVELRPVSVTPSLTHLSLWHLLSIDFDCLVIGLDLVGHEYALIANIYRASPRAQAVALLQIEFLDMLGVAEIDNDLIAPIGLQLNDQIVLVLATQLDLFGSLDGS